MNDTVESDVVGDDECVIGAVCAWDPSLVHVSELNPRLPRMDDDPDGRLLRLAGLIEQHGQIDPCIGRPHPDRPGEVELCAGARRLVVIRHLNGAEGDGGWEVDVILRQLDDRAFLEVMLVEQIESDEFSPMELARAVRQLVNVVGADLDFDGAERSVVIGEVAARLSRSVTWVYDRLSMLELSADAQLALDGGGLPIKAAKELARMPEALQEQAVEEFAGKDLTQAGVVQGMRERFQPELVDEFLSRTEGEVAWPGEVSELLDEEGGLLPGTDYYNLAAKPGPGELVAGFDGRVPTFGEILGEVKPESIVRVGMRENGKKYRLATKAMVREADSLRRRSALRRKPIAPHLARDQNRLRGKGDELLLQAKLRVIYKALLGADTQDVDELKFLRGLVRVLAQEVPADRLAFLRRVCGMDLENLEEMRDFSLGELLASLVLLVYSRKQSASDAVLEGAGALVKVATNVEVDAEAEAFLENERRRSREGSVHDDAWLCVHCDGEEFGERAAVDELHCWNCGSGVAGKGEEE